MISRIQLYRPKFKQVNLRSVLERKEYRQFWPVKFLFEENSERLAADEVAHNELDSFDRFAQGQGEIVARQHVLQGQLEKKQKKRSNWSAKFSNS